MIGLVITLLVVGLLLWLVNSYMQSFGIIGSLQNIRIR